MSHPAWNLPPDCQVWPPSGRKYRPEQMSMLGALFAKGPTLVLSTRGVLPGVDPKAFELIAAGRFNEPFGSYDWAYAGNGEVVYFASSLSAPHKVTTRRPAGFRHVGRLHASDGERVYWEGRVLDHADPPSFRTLDRHVGCDAVFAWFRNIRIDGANPRSLRVIAPSPESDLPLCADDQQAFFGEHLVLDADGASFERWGDGARDASRQWSRSDLYACIAPRKKRELVFSDEAPAVELHESLFKDHPAQWGQFLLACHEGSISAYEKLSRGRIGEASLIRAIKRLNEISPTPVADVTRDRIVVTATGTSMFRRHREGVALVRKSLDLGTILRQLLE